uniref:Uncharacterized protein n=1 Tax=Eutreptiella gymnastica TaxID=73025 RepID=A0A7S1IGT8_9EUGL
MIPGTSCLVKASPLKQQTKPVSMSSLSGWQIIQQRQRSSRREEPVQTTSTTKQQHKARTKGIDNHTVSGAGTPQLKQSDTYAWCVPSLVFCCLSDNTLKKKIYISTL